MCKKALILGVNGMDGKTLTSILLDKGYKVIGTYRRNTIDLHNEIHSLYSFNTNLTFSYCDINDYSSVKFLLEKNQDVDEIYLLAAQSHVALSFSSPNTSIQNGASVFNVLDNVKNLCNKAKVYFAATSELFGGANPEKPYNEESPYDCRSPYSIGKEMGTRWVKYYRQLGIFACYGVLFNHSNQLRSKDFFVRRVTNAAAQISLGKLKEIQLGNLAFYRDEHLSDFGCEMMWKMLQKDSPKDYVIATGDCHSGEEYLHYAFDFFNLDWKKYVKIDETRFRPNEVVKLVGDSTLAQKELGWKPNRINFSQHIALMCDWDYKIESGIKPVRPNALELYPT